MCYIILILLCVMFLLELIQTEVHHVRTLKIMQKVSMSFRLLSCDVYISYGFLIHVYCFYLLLVLINFPISFIIPSYVLERENTCSVCKEQVTHATTCHWLHSIGVEGVKLTANTDFYLFRFFTRECWIPWICHRILSIRYCQGLTIYYK